MKFIEQMRGSKQRENLPHLVELYEEIIKGFGGAKEFANKVVFIFNESPPGSPTQARLIEAVMTGIKILSENGMIEQESDLDEMTTEELDKFIESTVRKQVEGLLSDEAGDDHTHEGDPAGTPADA